MPSALRQLRVGSALAKTVPLELLGALCQLGSGIAGPRLLPDKAQALGFNLARVAESETVPLVPDFGGRRGRGRSAYADSPTSGDHQVRQGFGSYGRYWAESLRLPHLSPERIDRGFSYIGHGHIQRVRATGTGPIVVLPHLGGWEWAAAWLAVTQGIPVTAVVERLEPPEVFDWFAELRSGFGVNVVPLGPGAMSELSAALEQRHVVCLVADRDIGGTGVDIDFFGRPTRLPVGPAVLARRTGAPLVPTGVFFRGRQRVTVVTEPIYPEGRGRAENDRLTRLVTDRLESLVASAPEQWHVLERNW